MTQVLIALGANIWAENENGSPLHFSAEAGKYKKKKNLRIKLKSLII